MPVIHVVAALVVDSHGRMCLVRKRGTDAFMQPGGKPDPGALGDEPHADRAREVRPLLPAPHRSTLAG